MPAETFYCPHCRRQLTKSAQAYVMGELMSQKGQRFAATGGSAENVTCPGCLGRIDTQKMMLGEYDAPKGGGIGCMPVAVFLVTFIVLAIYASSDDREISLPIILGGAIIAAIAAYLIGKRRKASKAR